MGYGIKWPFWIRSKVHPSRPVPPFSGFFLQQLLTAAELKDIRRVQVFHQSAFQPLAMLYFGDFQVVSTVDHPLWILLPGTFLAALQTPFKLLAYRKFHRYEYLQFTYFPGEGPALFGLFGL